MRRLVVVLAVLAALTLVPGCGGGGGGDGAVAIGPGPGPIAPQAPAGAAIDTVPACNAPLATDPKPEDVRVAVLNYLDGLIDNPPRSEQDVQNLLNALTTFVVAEPNDAAAQLALALAIGLAGAYNAAADAGLNPAEMFELLPAGLELVPTSAKGPRVDFQKALMMPIELMTRLCFLRPERLAAPNGVKAVIPGLEAEGVTTEAVQIAIRNHLLPLVYSAIARAEALVANAEPPTDPLVVIGAGEDAWGVYPADVKMVLAFMHALRAFLHELVAYQLNTGDYDWDVDVITRDANGDGLLTVDEYAPPDPFLWLHPAPNMQIAGLAVREAIGAMIWAIQNCGDNSLVSEMVQETGWTAADMIGWLRDLRTLLTQQVNVQVDYDTVQIVGVAPAAVAQVPLNLGAPYDNPIGDIKDLLPILHIVCDLGDCWAEVADENDFPDLTFNGIFPDPLAIRAIVASDPKQVTITYNNIVIPLLDEGGFGVELP